jgi:hypothetical protein
VGRSNGQQNGGAVVLDGTPLTNGGAWVLEGESPVKVRVSIVGTAPIIMHAWNIESIDEKANAPKGSKAKKTDDIESYVYRTEDGFLGVPGTNFHAALIEAGRRMQDPSSPRKSAKDLVRAAIVPLTVIAPFEPHTKEWDYEDARRVTVQRAGVTRIRPAMHSGWKLTFELLITAPHYVSPPVLATLVNTAGLLIGLCDFRPTFGRFVPTGIEQLELDEELVTVG